MKAKIILYTIFFLFLISCVSYEEETKKALNSWIGSHKTKLIRQWGLPTREEKDDKGGEILLYEKTITKSAYNPPKTPKSAGAKAFVNSYNQNLTKTYYTAMFVDSVGIIYYWINGER